jgi:hypothetical protein
MKKIPPGFLGVMLLVIQFISAQEIPENNTISSKQDKIVHLESGINFSLPVHIMMYRTHRLAIGINARAWKNITPKFELGLKFDYDYRFIKNNSPTLTPEMTLEERASHSNFSLFCIKPNVQFNLNSYWYWGAESGLGYALSDADSKIGLGFVHEYGENQQFGLCSGLYLGKYFNIGTPKNELGLSLDFTQFLARWHAENSLALKLKYRFL